ncbi:23S rRNA (guanine745-N1)-methyltransferase [Alkalibacillus flavidus]|uniref:23S rRNA (Guanine745-N1)-methyltransferase n=1 Tax=Alkalibacillus flavidus TaxID=546021 RepID=A0ABV2KT47_9BACI
MGKLSKKQIAANRLATHDAMWRCPLCHQQLSMEDNARLTCSDGHAFDLAKQGYLNMAQQSHASIYDKTLFDARQRLNQAGFYEPLIDAISQVLANTSINVMLDAGSGEGSHLHALQQHLDAALAIGIDLAKDGVQYAAKSYDNAQWIVADLANIPLQNESVDVLLNILSPSNYSEFERVLKDDGLVVKVVPNSDYLKEIRNQLHKNTYSNDETVNRFRECFHVIQEERVNQTQSLSEAMFDDLIHMTPLTQDADLEKLSYIDHVTLDLTLLVGTKK